MHYFWTFCALVASLTPAAIAEFETTYHSSPLAIQPFTILERSTNYDPDNTTLFLTCPVGIDVAQPGPTIYDSHGNLVWADPSLGSCSNLDLQTYEGENYLTMWVGTGSPGTGQQTGSGNGIMLNSAYEIVRNVSAVNPEGTDAHEFNIVQPENKTALVTAYHPIPFDLTSVGGPANGWYLNALIQEIDIATGAVLFNWTSIDHIGFSESYNNLTQTGEGNTSALAWDAVHINSIAKDTAGNYLVSARHTQTVYKIHSNGTILWRLGGKTSDFTFIGNNTEFHWQHHARWHADETQISVFDDGAAVIETTIFIDEPVASGKFLTIDEDAMTASLAARFLPSPNSGPALAEGSTTLYGSTVVTGYGVNPWVMVQDFSTGAVLLSAIIGPNTTLPFGSITNYRAFQMSTAQFVGRPKQLPSVALVGGDVFVSWNGATNVAEWTLFTGTDPKDVTKKVTTVHKTGFETQISGAGTSAFIAVAALAADGTTLGKSAVYSTSNGTVV